MMFKSRVLFLTLVCFLFAGAVCAEDAKVDPLVKWRAVQEKRVEEERKKRAIAHKRMAERVKWITHKNADVVPFRPEQPIKLPKAIMLDGGRRSLSSVIGYFSDAAFSDYLWFEDQDIRHNAIRSLMNKIKHIGDMPAHNVINRWDGPVKITFKTLENDHQVDQEKYGYLIDHLKTLLPVYSEATGLKISYVEEEYPKRSDANVFIVLNARSEILNVFKNNRGPYFLDEVDYEEGYVSAVRFTPEIRSQVEGFFIPNQSHEITNATCYLKPSLVPEEWSKALLAECVGRALGVPDTSGYNNGLLSNWNRGFDDLSKLAVHDRDTWNGRVWPDEEKEYQDWVAEVDARFAQKKPKYVSPTEYDLKLLSMLYCPLIKPGMDKHEAVLTLLRNESCVANVQQE